MGVHLYTLSTHQQSDYFSFFLSSHSRHHTSILVYASGRWSTSLEHGLCGDDCRHARLWLHVRQNVNSQPFVLLRLLITMGDCFISSDLYPIHLTQLTACLPSCLFFFSSCSLATQQGPQRWDVNCDGHHLRLHRFVGGRERSERFGARHAQSVDRLSVPDGYWDRSRVSVPLKFSRTRHKHQVT